MPRQSRSVSQIFLTWMFSGLRPRPSTLIGLPQFGHTTFIRPPLRKWHENSHSAGRAPACLGLAVLANLLFGVMRAKFAPGPDPLKDLCTGEESEPPACWTMAEPSADRNLIYHCFRAARAANEDVGFNLSAFCHVNPSYCHSNR